MALTKQMKAAWIAEMRDPNTQQCFNTYYMDTRNRDDFPVTVCAMTEYPKETNCMCALGCLIKQSLLNDHKATTYSWSDTFTKAFGVPIDPYAEDDTGGIDYKGEIIKMNDIERKSLVEIADWVEANVPTID